MDLRKTAPSNLEESGLQEHIAHWAEVLDRWVLSIDTRLGRQERGVPASPLDGSDVGEGAEQ